MNKENENKVKSSLDESTKHAIKQTWNIDVDSEILSPLVDYIFKRIFTADDTNSKAALIDFINSLLEHENDDKIIDLTIVNPQIPVDRGTEKKSIFDIRAKYNSGRQAVIEMQKDPTPDFKKRSQHIISKTYASQEISGSDYDKLEKCYLICITNFNIIKETNDYIKDYRYRDRQGNDLTDDETIIFLDLSKIDDVLKKSVDEMTNVEKWAIFFKYVSDDSKRDILNKILEREEGIRMATNILLQVSKDEEARAYYESELRFQLDQNSRYNHAIREGKRVGKLEGKLEGIAEGEISGTLKEKLATALRLLDMGLSMEQAVTATKLSEEDIQNELNKHNMPKGD
jgi:predicted transposase/invertase (TIGR01784 family)